MNNIISLFHLKGMYQFNINSAGYTVHKKYVFTPPTTAHKNYMTNPLETKITVTSSCGISNIYSFCFTN